MTDITCWAQHQTHCWFLQTQLKMTCTGCMTCLVCSLSIPLLPLSLFLHRAWGLKTSLRGFSEFSDYVIKTQEGVRVVATATIYTPSHFFYFICSQKSPSQSECSVRRYLRGLIHRRTANKWFKNMATVLLPSLIAVGLRMFRSWHWSVIKNFDRVRGLFRWRSVRLDFQGVI